MAMRNYLRILGSESTKSLILSAVTVERLLKRTWVTDPTAVLTVGALTNCLV